MWRKVNKSTKQHNTKKETQTISKISDPCQFANSPNWALVDGGPLGSDLLFSEARASVCS